MKTVAIISVWLLTITPIFAQNPNINPSNLINIQQQNGIGGVATNNATTSPGNSTENQTTVAVLRNFDFIYKFRYFLRTEEVPEFLIDLILKNSTQYNITANDVIELYGIDGLSLNQTLDLLRSYRIAPETVFSINTLELLLNLTSLSFNNYYEVMKTRLNLTGPIIMEAMDDLAVDKNKFSGALTFELYNMFDVLRNGSYTERNINQALKTINRTSDQVYNTTRDIIFEKMKKLDPVSFRKVLNQFKLDKIRLLLLWNILNITLTDVNNVPNFGLILNRTIDNLNGMVKPAISIGAHNLVTHESIFDEWWSVQNIAKGHVQPLRNSTSSNEVFYRGINKGSNIVELYSNQIYTKFINLTTDYHSFNNCLYLSIGNDSEIVEQRTEIVGFDKNSKEILIKSWGFNLGNPLICDGKLYGLARGFNGSGIIIDGFYEETSIVSTQGTITEKPVIGNGTVIPSGVGTTDRISNSLLVSILVTYFIYCLIN